MKILDPQKLEHYRVAAMVGQRLSAIRTHTVQVQPEDLAALVDRYTDGLVDHVKIAVAEQCSCEAPACLHDRIRAVIRTTHGDWQAAKDELLQKLQAAERSAARAVEDLHEATKQPYPVGTVAKLRVRNYSLKQDIALVGKIVALARSLGPENVGVPELLDQIDAALKDDPAPPAEVRSHVD